MSGETLAELIQKFDEDAKVQSNGVQFMLNERELFMVFDAKADRMRIITPIAQAGLANEEVLTRMLQANYDAVWMCVTLWGIILSGRHLFIRLVL